MLMLVLFLIIIIIIIIMLHSFPGPYQRSGPGCASLHHGAHRARQRDREARDPWPLLAVQRGCEWSLACPGDEHHLSEAAQEPEPVPGVMYDYLRLEGPCVVPAANSSPEAN